MRQQAAVWTVLLLGLAGLRVQADAPAAKPPIRVNELYALCKEAPVQATDDQRQAFGRKVAAFGDKLKGRTAADRVAFSSVSDAPRTPGKPKTYVVVCGPVKDPDVRLAVVLRTTSGKVSNMDPGTEISFTGKVVGARYDTASMMVLLLVDEAKIQ